MAQLCHVTPHEGPSAVSVTPDGSGRRRKPRREGLSPRTARAVVPKAGPGISRPDPPSRGTPRLRDGFFPGRTPRAALSWAGGAVPPETPLQPSPEQRALVDARRADPAGSLRVLAFAGSGKTTALRLLAGRGRPLPRPLPGLQQGRPAPGPGPLPRPRRLPHRPQPRLPCHPDVRAAAPARAPARRPRGRRAARDPRAGRPAPGLLGLLRRRHRARLHPRRRARDRRRPPPSPAPRPRPRRDRPRLGARALGSDVRPDGDGAARARRLPEAVASPGRPPAGRGRGPLPRRGPGREP